MSVFFTFENAQLLHDIFKLLEDFSEEIELNFKKNMLFIYQLDGTRVLLAYYKLPKEIFKCWSVDKNIRVALDINRLLDALSNVTDATTVNFSIRSDKVLISLIDFRVQERELPILYSDKIQKAHEIKATYTVKCKVELKPFIKDLTFLHGKIDTLSFTVNDKDKLILQGLSESQDILYRNIYFKPDILLQLSMRKPAKSYYTCGYLVSVFPKACLKLFDIAVLEFGKDTPLKVSFIPKCNELIPCKFIHYIAPRLVDEGEKE